MKRILFVDDEPQILQGLQRMLRPHRQEWDMHFAESGAAALEALEAESFDVVVSDMRMPRMDGARLLKEVQSRSPRTVRIILSGHADLEAAMRSVCVSHQYLSKPCNADELKAVVRRACRLEELLHDPNLRAVIGDVSDLPSLPKTYRALVEALGEEEIDLPKVASIVEGDAGITAKMLQLVNSSFFGVRQEMTSVAQATSYLGVLTIRDLVLSAEVFRDFDTGVKLPGFSLEKEQHHSGLTARIARALFSDKKTAEQAYLAGMLHDIGKLVLASHAPERLRATLEGGAGSTAPAHVVEARELQVTHAEIGAYLLGLWGLPYPIVEAVAFHHRPEAVGEVEDFNVLLAVHVADALAQELTHRPEPARARINEDLLGRLNLLDRVPTWRRLAEQEVSGAEEAA